MNDNNWNQTHKNWAAKLAELGGQFVDPYKSNPDWTYKTPEKPGSLPIPEPEGFFWMESPEADLIGQTVTVKHPRTGESVFVWFPYRENAVVFYGHLQDARRRRIQSWRQGELLLKQVHGAPHG